MKIGDILRVLPEETIPVAGVILSRNMSVNQAVIIRKFLLVDKAEIVRFAG